MDTPIEERFEHYLTNGYRVTECLLVQSGMVVAYGASFCAPNDQYDRKKGNRIARGRAHKALERKALISPIRRTGVPNPGFPFKGIAIEAF